MCQVAIQQGDHLRGGSFLRPEDGGCAFGAAQRAGHIAGHLNVDTGQPAVQRGDINMMQRAQRAASRWQPVALAIEKADTQRLRHPRTAVVGGAAAQPENDFFNAAIEAGQDQLSGAPAGGQQRIAGVLIHIMNAAGRGHLNHRGIPPAHDAEAGGDRGPERAGHRKRNQLSAGGINQRLGGAFAAVCHGNVKIAGIREDASESGFHRDADLLCGHALFKGVRG